MLLSEIMSLIYGGNLFWLSSPRIFKTGHFLDGFTSLSVYRSPNCPTRDGKSCAQECTGRFNPIASGGPCLKHLAQACTCVGTRPIAHTKHVSRAKIARRLIRLCKRPSFHRQLSRRVSTPRSVTPPRGTLSLGTLEQSREKRP